MERARLPKASVSDKLVFVPSQSQKSWRKASSIPQGPNLWRQKFAFDLRSEFFILLFQNDKKGCFMITVSDSERKLVPFSLSFLKGLLN